MNGTSEIIEHYEKTKFMVIGIEGEEFQAKGQENIFNYIISQICKIQRKRCLYSYNEHTEYQIGPEYKLTISCYRQNIEYKEQRESIEYEAMGWPGWERGKVGKQLKKYHFPDYNNNNYYSLTYQSQFPLPHLFLFPQPTPTLPHFAPQRE